jgi:ribosome-binding protein aMBF1 (putative translation factor)
MMIGLQRVELAGKRFVIIEETEYERLCREAGTAADDPDLPEFPKPDKHGRYPAVEYTRISIARDLIRLRKGAGLSQQQLANLAGLRQETISRLESGKHTATPQTIGRIERAIKAAGRRKKQGV